jgi:ribosomal protein L37AE/L43A
MKTVKVKEGHDCQFCENEAKYDARTKMGPWAFLCQSCFDKYGVGVGVGRGQKLEVRKNE